MRTSLMPMERAASTKSCSFTLSTAPRQSLANRGVTAMPMATIRLFIPEPMAAMKRMPRIRVGKHISTSTMRIMKRSR